MLFNKNNNGAEEIRKLIGTYYATNNFEKIQPFIEIEERIIIDLIGQPVYDRAQQYYLLDTQNNELNSKLLKLIQYPLAVLGNFRMNQANIVSHEDSGRKFKIDPDNEKMPWEWMYDRDDAAHLRLAYESVETLIQFLNSNAEGISEWKNSDAFKNSRKTFITSAKQFNNIYPIDNSHRFFISITPFMEEIERKEIRPAIGVELFDALKLAHQSNDGITDSVHKAVYELICDMIPLATMVLAAKRFNIQVMPEGVTQRILSESESRHAADPVSAESLRTFADHLSIDADQALDDIKVYLESIDPEADDYPLIPDNDPDNKYFRT